MIPLSIGGVTSMKGADAGIVDVVALTRRP